MKHQFQGLEPEIQIENSPKFADFSKLRGAESGVEVVFVVGCPRSGTTLLGNILGGNKQMVNGDESMFLLDHWNVFSHLMLGNNRRKSSYLASFSTSQKVLGYSSDFAQSVFSDLLRSKNGARIAVDHTPVYSHLFYYLEKIFHNPKYLHIVRNEADVVKSLKRVRKNGAIWGQEDDKTRREYRQYWIEKSRLIGKSIPDRFFEITYEDLLKDPKSTLNEFLTANHLLWESQMKNAFTTLYSQ